MKKLFVYALVALSSVSCSTYTYTATSSMENTQARILNANASAYVTPLTVELDVSSRVTDVWTLTKEEAESDMGGNLANIRSWAAYKSARKYDADVIVSPIFNITSNSAGDGYEVEVIGFPAKYTNWKSATKEDYEWMAIEKGTSTNAIQNTTSTASDVSVKVAPTNPYTAPAKTMK